MIRIALVGDIGSGKSYFKNYLIIQYLTQTTRCLKFIKKKTKSVTKI